MTRRIGNLTSIFLHSICFGLIATTGDGAGEFNMKNDDAVHNLKRRDDVINIDEYHDRYCKPLYACEGIGALNFEAQQF